MAADKSEALILKYITSDKKFLLEASKAISPDYFSSDVIREIYSGVLENYNDPGIREIISREALTQHFKNKGFGELGDTVPKVFESLDKLVAKPEDFGFYLTDLKRKHNMRLAGSFAAKIASSVAVGLPADEINKMFKEALSGISKINQIEIFDEGTIGADAAAMKSEYEQIERDPFGFRGVTIGFPSLDNITNGFHGSELVIISGMEGTGKSLLMMNMGVNAWLGTNKPGMTEFHDNGANVLYFTLEMPRSNRGKPGTSAYLNKRIVSCLSELPFGDIRMGKLSESDRVKLFQTYEFIEKYDKKHKFYVVDIPRGAKLEDIEVKYLELKEQFPIDLVIIDYIGIMAGPDGVDGDSDWKAQGYIAAGLHEFARTYNVPVLTAAQVTRPQGVNNSLNKQNYNTTRVARSAMITQNANIVLQIGARDEEWTYSDMPIYITKMRDGQTGKLSFNKAFERMRVYDGTPINSSAELTDFEDFAPEPVPETPEDMANLTDDDMEF